MILSPKEYNVLTLAACGFSDKEIAEKLKISVRTVQTYFIRLINKLEAKSRMNAAVIYYQKNKNWKISERHLI